MGYRIAIVGATGNVGREMLNILDEFPIADLGYGSADAMHVMAEAMKLAKLEKPTREILPNETWEQVNSLYLSVARRSNTQGSCRGTAPQALRTHVPHRDGVRLGDDGGLRVFL